MKTKIKTLYFQWYASLIDKDSWDNEKRILVLFQAEVTAPNPHLAKKELFLKASQQPWWPITVKFMDVYDYLRVKNKIDNRKRDLPEADLKEAFAGFKVGV